ncbi:MAG: hypothetical protein JNM86_00065 [Phycisphaerae bacterium]|nr:hypothetical protein [Phycisphaerae bacterium]
MPRKPNKNASSQDRTRSGAGAATLSGGNFQEDVCAWIAIQILAESSTPPSFGLPADVTLENAIAETFESVDDLRAGTSAGGEVFFQCKRSLSLSDSPTGELASVVNQFVGQMLRGAPLSDGTRRPIDPSLDRLVLAVHRKAPKTITEHLDEALKAIRPAAATALCGEVTANRNQELANAIGALRKLFDKTWRQRCSSDPTPEEWARFVRLIRIRSYNLGEDGDDWRECEGLIRNQILIAPAQSSQALHAIGKFVRDFGPLRTGTDRRGFRDILGQERISLQAVRSAQGDVEMVRRFAKDELAAFQCSSEIITTATRLKIKRKVVSELVGMARTGDVLLIGEPGAGKSGCLSDFVAEVTANGAQCVVMQAGSLHADSPATVAQGIGLTIGHNLPDTLAAWDVNYSTADQTSPRFFIIDALDAARGEFSLPKICELLKQVRRRAPDWRFIVSIREFDLRYSRDVQDLFAGNPHHQLQSASFPDVRHIEVRRLTPEEMADACSQSAPLKIFLATQSTTLKALVTNPFNLSLLVQLLEMKVPIQQLSRVRVRTDLFELYWQKRVVEHDPDSKLETAAQALIEEMKKGLSPTADRAAINNKSEATRTGTTGLLKQGVVRSTTVRAGLGNSERLQFAHHVLFDFVAARLWLRDLPDPVIAELAPGGSEHLLLFARPSLVLTLEALWHTEPDPTDQYLHEVFWKRAMAIASSNVRPIGKILAPGVAAGEFRILPDLAYPLNQLGMASALAATELIRFMVMAGRSRVDPARPQTCCVGDEAAEWMELAATLAQSGNKELQWQARLLLTCIQRDPQSSMTPSQATAANRASRTLIDTAL